ncbi:MAG: beta-ketoacyl-[acyl-carrier-protein] synthase family protein [Casimicrobiaceae bacterium]
MLKVAIPVVAYTLINACGAGEQTVWRALTGDASGLRPNDFAPAEALDTWIGRVADLEQYALPPSLAQFDCRNHRLAFACLEQDGFAAAVHAASARHGKDRIGVFVGTSTSGIFATELVYRDLHGASGASGAAMQLSPDFYRYRHCMYAVSEFVRASLDLKGPAMTVSTACSSSAKVFAQAARAIAAGICDAAVVGGVDSLALSTLYGFHALGLLSRRPCAPFDADRDGISIGEAAGFALLEPGADGAVALVGYGESCDGHHMSSPHPQGAGAVKAMRDALASASLRPGDIDYVNLHGTGSQANDVAEDLAMVTVFGTGTPAGSTKGWTGHTLGAAGITEALITIMAIRGGWLPGTLHCRTPDSTLQTRIATTSRPAVIRHAMSNSFGFGGNNCSLVFGALA